jgi:hypothetical protein
MRPVAASGLLAGALAAALALPGAARAQGAGGAFVNLSAGAAFKPSGVVHTSGAALAVAVGRYVSRRVALRLDAGYAQFMASSNWMVTAPCTKFAVLCMPPAPSCDVRMVSAFAGVQLHERADRQGFYAFAGAGPSLLPSEPGGLGVLRFALQAGGGVEVRAGPATLVLEAAYRRFLNATGELRQVVPVTLGVRLGSPL